MNTIATVPASRGERTYFEIEVDGRLLAQHFAGRLGAHPSRIPALGWSSASPAHRADTVAELLAEKPSGLESGRVPILVCEDCGDIACGAIVVRVIRDGNHIKWTDWSYENGYEAGRGLEWPTQPGELVFDAGEYEAAIRRGL